jgi:hypothetical protein
VRKYYSPPYANLKKVVALFTDFAARDWTSAMLRIDIVGTVNPIIYPPMVRMEPLFSGNKTWGGTQFGNHCSSYGC